MEATDNEIHLFNGDLLNQTAQELHVRLALYDMLFNQLPTPICISVDSKTIFTVNDAMLRFCGISQQELLGRTFLETLKSLGMTSPQSMQGTSQSVQTAFISQNGLYYRVEIIPYLDCGKIAIVYDVMDTQEAQGIITAISSNSPGGIFKMRLDADLHILYGNEIFYMTHGYTEAQIKAELQSKAIRLIYSDDLPCVQKVLSDAVAHGEDMCTFEARIVKRDKKLRWMLVSGRFIDTPTGKVMYGFIVDCTESKVLEQKLKISEERFRIALSMTEIGIWEYDFKTKEIHPYNSSLEKRLMWGDIVTNVPESLVESNVVHPDFAAAFYQMHEQMRNGEQISSSEGKIRNRQGEYWWVKIIYHSIYDEAGKPIRAIGTCEDIDSRKKMELRFQQETEYRESAAPGVIASYVVNFTRDVFESCLVQDSRSMKTQPNEAYDTVMNTCAVMKMNDETRRAFLNAFSRVSIMEAFEQGKTELSLEYNVLNEDGTHSWLQTVIRLVVDSGTKEKKGFLYVFDIDKRKCEELAVARKLESDPLTGLYNRVAAENRIRELLGTAEGRQTGVFMMLDIDMFKEINDTYGHPFGDKILVGAAEILQSSFRDADIVGRCGGDEFCTFFCGLKAKKRVEQIAMQICEKMRDLYLPAQGKPEISCSIGISMCDGTVKTFAEIYEEADKALYMVKRNGRNGYAFFGDEKYQKSQKWIQNPEWILNIIDAAVYICDAENYNLLYMNDTVLSLFHTERDKCFGKKCYEVLGDYNEPCSFCFMKRLAFEQSLDRIYHLPGTEKMYLMKGQLITWHGRTAHLEIAIDVSSMKDGIK